MKTYFKILGLTTLIQLGFAVICWISYLLKGGDTAAIIILTAGFVLSVVVDIVLAIKWGESLKCKLCCIFLMLTNYTPLILFAVIMLSIFWLALGVLEFLDSLALLLP